MAFKKFRKMKVYETSGYNYKRTPSIILKGDWLKEMINTDEDRETGCMEFEVMKGRFSFRLTAPYHGTQTGQATTPRKTAYEL